MYFSGLRKLIGSAEEVRFYDVAILYLSAQRYRDLAIVDGAGDGGRDVVCSRKDLRIQLSVRRDWQNKINEEAAKTAKLGLKNLIYVTNRSISTQAEEAFRASKFLYAGDVDVSIHDLNRISTGLARPGRIGRAYEMLGASVSPTVQASTSEIAVSSLLLFGQEASELREEIVEANIRAYLLKHPHSREAVLVDEVARGLPGVYPDKAVLASVNRMRTAGKIVGPKDAAELSPSETARMQTAEDEFLFAFDGDVSEISKKTGLSRDDSKELLDRAMELLLQGSGLSNGDAASESVRAFLSTKGLSKKSKEIYGVLSRCSIAKHFQYGKTISEIFSANTFDIYRALGGRSDVTMVLDTSVALPMLFGLEFRAVTSRYSLGASTLSEVCRAHTIPMLVPRPYVNEMASHGLKAIEFLESYDALPDDIKPFLRGSGNAYLSHYSHVHTALLASGTNLSLNDFLSAFGISKGASIRKVENRIISLLEAHGFTIGMTSYYDSDVRDRIAEAKSKYESKIIIEHDAAVCTNLINDSAKGYILATWDKVMIDIVQGLARVYADSPSRVTDFLALIEGVDYEFDRTAELLTTLVYIDERYAERLARKLEQIRTPQQAFQLRTYIEEARQSRGEAWLPDVDDLTHFLDSSSPNETSSSSPGDPSLEGA
jgi:hypothetical protein